jgi:CrcB protein
VTGLLGAFTTFSTFSFETMKLIESGKMLHATANAAGSVVACVFAVMAGIAVARAL